jgi:KUP system potassium uptake protein
MANADASSDDTDAVFPASSGGGVYPSRPAHYETPLQRKLTNDPKIVDVELASVTEGGDYDERDFHKKQVSDGVNVFLESY